MASGVNQVFVVTVFNFRTNLETNAFIYNMFVGIKCILIKNLMVKFKIISKV